MKRSHAAVRRIDAALLRRWRLPELGRHADKSTRGDVLVIGGSREIPGAVQLAGEAALRSGAGRVCIATAASAATALAVAFPEARVVGLPESSRGELRASVTRGLLSLVLESNAVILGPGMFDDALPRALLKDQRLLRHSATLVLDAAALRAFGKRLRARFAASARIIVTPHAGEMAELCGCAIEDVHESPLELAEETARRWGITVVLKGQRTFIVDPEGNALLNTAGNSGLATAGSGDTLAGIIAGLAARGAAPTQAAAWGVHLHALAGEELARKRGPLGYLARELAAELPKVLGKLSRR